MNIQKIIAPIVVLLLGLVLAVAITKSHKQQTQQQAVEQQAASLVTVHGLIGSEKKDFLTDPKVLDVLKKNGIDLTVDTSGSREMAKRPDFKGYDFAFPAGVPAARKLMQAQHVSKNFTPFFSPMTVASWKPIADVLQANGIVKQDKGDYYIVDMQRLLSLISANKRWTDLKGASGELPNRSILISSTDIRSSNSAAMYLSLASYLYNGGEVVQGAEGIKKVLPQVTPLFLRQGWQESSSAGPFEDYTTMGIGKAPLVMIYEQQFLEYALAHRQNRNGEMVLLYPKPTVFTKHVLIPFTDAGAKLGDLLTNNADLQHLEVDHGFRIADSAYQQSAWQSAGIKVPVELVDVVDPPSYEVLEAMISDIEQKLNSL